MENNWKIIASSVEEFEEIEEKLKKLPFAVREKIEIAEKDPLFESIVCKLNITAGHTIQTFSLPKDVFKIMNFDGEYNFIMAYSPKFIFKIEETNLWKFKNFRINFEFVE